jgi:hypothetical protein
MVELLAAAAVHERVAALETHDILAALRMFDQQRVDLFLRGTAAADELADVETRGIAAREVEHLGRHQPVVNDHVGFLQRAQALQGHEPGVAWAGADEHHVTLWHGRGIVERARGEILGALVASGAQRSRPRVR